MNQQFVYLAGMPRAGSTLLSSILNQNPEIFASSSSPLCNMLHESEFLWRKQVSLGANRNDEAVIRVMKSMIPSFYSDKKQKIIIDKSFHWGLPNHLKLLSRFSPTPPKFIIMNRDLEQVIESNIRLFIANPKNGIVNDSMVSPFNKETIKKFLLSEGGPISDCIVSLKNILTRYPSSSYVVDYSTLCKKPWVVIDGIYELLGITRFNHWYKGITNTNTDNDDAWGIPDMHKIRPNIEHI